MSVCHSWLSNIVGSPWTGVAGTRRGWVVLFFMGEAVWGDECTWAWSLMWKLLLGRVWVCCCQWHVKASLDFPWYWALRCTLAPLSPVLKCTETTWTCPNASQLQNESSPCMRQYFGKFLPTFHLKELQFYSFALQALAQLFFWKVECSIMHLCFEKGWNMHKREALAFLSYLEFCDTVLISQHNLPGEQKAPCWYCI